MLAVLVIVAALTANEAAAFAPGATPRTSSRRRPLIPPQPSNDMAWHPVAHSTPYPLRASFVDAITEPLFLEHMATGGVLAFVGDVIAQGLTSERQTKPDGTKEPLAFPPEDWDVIRTAALVVFGSLYTGGVQHFIFGFLNSSFEDPIRRLLLAQFFFIPFCYYPTFLLMVPALRAGFGPEAAETRERLTGEVMSKLPATLVRNWCFWLPVQFVQFNFVPADLQVTYCAAFGVIWNAILSWSTMESSAETAAADK